MMKIQRRIWIGSLPLLGIVLTLLLSACSGTPASATTASDTTNGPGTTSGPTLSVPTKQNGGQSSPPLLKVLQAMQQVKSVHLDVTSRGTVLSSGGTLNTSAQQQALPYTLKASSTISVTSQQEQGQIHFTQGTQGQNITEIVSGNKLYYRTTTPTNTPAQSKKTVGGNQWMIVDLAQLAGQQQGTSGQMQAQELLTRVMQSATVTDHGIVALKGVRAHHLTLMLSEPTLAQIANNTAQPLLKQVLASSQVQTLLQVDLFVNEASSLPLRVGIKGQVQINTDMLMGRGRIKQSDIGVPPHMVQVNALTTITFSRYNQPVKITAPTGAPTSAQPQQ